MRQINVRGKVCDVMHTVYKIRWYASAIILGLKMSKSKGRSLCSRVQNKCGKDITQSICFTECIKAEQWHFCCVFGRKDSVPIPAWLLIPIYFKAAWLTTFFHYIRGVNCILMKLQSQSHTQMLPDVWWAQTKKKSKPIVVFFNQKLQKEHDLNQTQCLSAMS